MAWILRVFPIQSFWGKTWHPIYILVRTCFLEKKTSETYLEEDSIGDCRKKVELHLFYEWTVDPRDRFLAMREFVKV